MLAYISDKNVERTGDLYRAPYELSELRLLLGESSACTHAVSATLLTHIPTSNTLSPGAGWRGCVYVARHLPAKELQIFLHMQKHKLIDAGHRSAQSG